MSTFVVYSPLCDSDPVVYERYLRSCDAVADAFLRRCGCGARAVLERGKGWAAIGDVPGVDGPVGVVGPDGSSGGSLGVGGAGGESLDGAGREKLCAVPVEELGSGERSRGADVDGKGWRPVAARAEELKDVQGVGGVSSGGGVRGLHWARNCAWREKKKRAKLAKNTGGVPEWRRGAAVGAGASCRTSATSVPSLSGSVRTVDTRTAEEIEAARTFAARRVIENKIAVARGEHVLASLADKEKTAALQRLAVARMEERINTARARSQASYKKCGSEIESAGSAASAGEFALRQELRQKDAWKKRHDYLMRQMDEAMKYLSPAGKQAVAALPEPYIPTDAEIAEQDEDVSPFKSYEEMQEDMRRYFAGEIL